MGVIRDSVILVYGFGAAVAITSIVVAVFSTRYLDTYPNDRRDDGQKQDVYYSVFYIRVLSIFTAIFLTCYMAWMYADSRHRVDDEKNRKLFAFNKLRLHQMALAVGQKSAAHRKKLLIGFSILFVLWLPPALIMCFGGWLYKWKKPNKSATLLDVCTVGKARSATCDRLYETGVTALVQTLFIFLAALTMFIASRSSGIEYDIERQKIADAREALQGKFEKANADAAKLQAGLKAEVDKAKAAETATATALAQERDRRAALEARARLDRRTGGRRGHGGGRNDRRWGGWYGHQGTSSDAGSSSNGIGSGSQSGVWGGSEASETSSASPYRRPQQAHRRPPFIGRRGFRQPRYRDIPSFLPLRPRHHRQTPAGVRPIIEDRYDTYRWVGNTSPSVDGHEVYRGDWTRELRAYRPRYGTWYPWRGRFY